MKRAVSFGGGMRILRQEKWETLISFILSQNNNITRIKNCVESLCASFGKPIGTYKGKMRYAFPTPENLSGLCPEESGIYAGWRLPGKYVIETSKQIASDGGEDSGKHG